MVTSRGLACGSRLPQRQLLTWRHTAAAAAAVPIAAAVATEAPPIPSSAREQLSFERYDGPGITVEVSLQDASYQVRCCNCFSLPVSTLATDCCPS